MKEVNGFGRPTPSASVPSRGLENGSEATKDWPSISPGRLVGDQPDNEADYFYVCGECGGAVDMRDLASVFRHEEPDHAPRVLS